MQDSGNYTKFADQNAPKVVDKLCFFLAGWNVSFTTDPDHVLEPVIFERIFPLRDSCKNFGLSSISNGDSA